MKDPKKENNKPEEDNRLIEVADEELDSVTGGYSYRDDKDQVFHDDNLYCADTKYLWQDDGPGELNISHNLR